MTYRPARSDELMSASFAALRRALRSKRIANLVAVSLRLGCAAPALPRALAELSAVAGGDRRAIELALVQLRSMQGRLRRSAVVSEAIAVMVALERFTATS